MWRMMRRFARNDAAFAVNGGNPREPAIDERPFSERLVRFGSIGVVSSAVFALGFLLLAGPLGYMAAAVVALAVCSVANHAANRRLTFALTGPARRLRHFARGLVVAAVPFAATIATLSVLSAVGSTRTLTALTALTIVNVVVGLVRFGLLQRWVFRRQP
jgi:putative flippase GtrA